MDGFIRRLRRRVPTGADPRPSSEPLGGLPMQALLLGNGPGDLGAGSLDRRVFFFVLAAACSVLALHAASYLPFVSDDALISMRYAQRLLDGQGLTWNDGEHVEGYSNLLWILACAALGAAGIDLIAACRILGLAGMAAAIAAVVHAYTPRRAPEGDPPADSGGFLPALVGGMGLALAGPIAIWAIGGLEQPLLAGLLAWALVLVFPLFDGQETPWRKLMAPGLLFGLVALTRPDGALFAAVTCICLVLLRRGKATACKQAALLAALPAAFYLGQLAFRLAYYGDWVPNSTYVKMTPGSRQLQDGWQYIRGGGARMLPLLLAAAAALVALKSARFRQGRTVLLATILLVWALYVLIVGGDLFPGRRHLVPVFLVSALLAANATEYFAVRFAFRRGAVGATAAALLAALFLLQMTDAENRRAKEELWEWDGEVVGRFLDKAFGDKKPLLAVDPAGCVPYFSRLPSIDMLGLNDKHIARYRRPDSIQVWLLGHHKGDGAYVLGRQPDLVLFTIPRGGKPVFPSALDMWWNPRFHQTYDPVYFDATDPHPLRSMLWVKREGGPIGIRRAADSVVVPGYFLCPQSQLHVPTTTLPNGPTMGIGSGSLDPSGVAGCRVESGVKYWLTHLPLTPGRWEIRTEPAAAEVRLAARPMGGEHSLLAVANVCTATVPQSGGAIDVVVEVAGVPAVHVRSLLLHRID